MRLTFDSTSSIYIATSGFTSDQIVENVLSVIPKIIERTPGKWSNVASIYLKSTNSIALPIYNSIKPAAKPKTGVSEISNEIQKPNSEEPAIESRS